MTSLRMSLTVGTTLLLTALAGAQERKIQLRPGESNWTPQEGVAGGLATTDLTGALGPADLVSALVGAGVSTSNLSYTGNDITGGLFTGGTGIVGFENGVVLSTGNVNSVVGPENVADNTSTDNALAGDPDLDVLAGLPTFDATVLEFDFECEGATDVSFQYAFASEEYNEFVFAGFNDVFAFFLNGTNIAIVPGDTIPVAIDNVNCGNPYDPPAGGVNCALFINNDCSDIGGGTFPCSDIATEMDGLTTVFSAVGGLSPGVNNIRLAIADAGDGIYDSNVFLRGASFDCALPGPAFEPPTPCGETLMISTGTELCFDIVAIATNGFPDQEVTITASGDSVPLTGGTFVPGLPVTGQPAMTTFCWTPQAGEEGAYTIIFTATDQFGVKETCSVTIEVAECYLLVGFTPQWEQAPFGGPEDLLLVNPTYVYPVTMVQIPSFHIPDVPGMQYARMYFQVYMDNPLFDPVDPVKMSNGLEVLIGGPSISYGPETEIHLNTRGWARPGGDFTVNFTIDGM